MSDHNRFEQQYAYQFIFNWLETSSVKWDSNPNMDARY